MLGDEDLHARRARFQTFRCLRSKTKKETLPLPISPLISQFWTPSLDLIAKTYVHLVKVDAAKVLEPPTTRFVSSQQHVIDDPLQMNYP